MAQTDHRRGRLSCRAVCPPGIEEVLAAELRTSGIRPGRAGRGGVSFDASWRQLYQANLWLRTSTRVLVRAGPPVTVRTWEDLEEAARRVPWGRWLRPGTPVRFRVTSKGSRLYHTGAIADRLGAVLAEERGRPAGPSTDEPQLVVVRVTHDELTLSIDSSGPPLHERGWRADGGKAPIRASLAAAAVLASGWTPSRPLVDPFCGAGTIPIEAGLIALDRPPGIRRAYAFERWPEFEPGTWASVAGEAGARRTAHPGVGPAIRGSDRDAGAVHRADTNAARAGVGGLVSFGHVALSDVEAPAGPAEAPARSGRPPGSGAAGWIVTNPPWGGRLGGGGDLRNLYARLGDVVRRRFDGWGAALLVADPRLARHSGLPLEERFATTSGGTRIHLLVAGPRREGLG